MWAVTGITQLIWLVLASRVKPKLRATAPAPYHIWLDVSGQPEWCGCPLCSPLLQSTPALLSITQSPPGPLWSKFLCLLFPLPVILFPIHLWLLLSHLPCLISMSPPQRSFPALWPKEPHASSLTPHHTPYFSFLWSLITLGKGLCVQPLPHHPLWVLVTLLLHQGSGW